MENMEETLMTLVAFSKDGDLKKALYQFIEQFKFYEQKGVVTMSSVIAHIEKRGRREAEKQFLAEKKSWSQEKKDLTQESGEMLFTLVILAQKTMIELGCSAPKTPAPSLAIPPAFAKRCFPFLIDCKEDVHCRRLLFSFENNIRKMEEVDLLPSLKMHIFQVFTKKSLAFTTLLLCRIEDFAAAWLHPAIP